MIYADCYVPDPVDGQYSSGTYHGYFRINLPTRVVHPTNISMKITVSETDPFEEDQNSVYILFISGRIVGNHWDSVNIKTIPLKTNISESIFFGYAFGKNVISIGSKSWEPTSIKVSDVIVTGASQTAFSYWDDNWSIQIAGSLGMTPDYFIGVSTCASYSWNKIDGIPTDIANRNADKLDGLDSTHYLGVTGWYRGNYCFS